MANKEIAKKNRTQVIVMLIAFPLLALFATYSLIWLANRDTLLETTNRGTFVDPPMLARELALHDAAGTPVDGSGTWWLWLATADCQAACTASLQRMRATRQQLRQHANQVRQALVTPPTPKSHLLPDGYPDTPRFTSKGNKTLTEAIYLIDPEGNLVLRYPADSPPEPMLEDLQRLLEVSEDA